MAIIREAFDKMLKLEFNSPKNALHWNKGETGWTYMGIYETAHPDWSGWRIIKNTVTTHEDIEKASAELYNNPQLRSLVEMFYEEKFWKPMKLDQVTSQKIAEEMFVMGVNAGTKVAIRLAQRVVGAKDDGVIGPMTITALNKCDEKMFDKEYDAMEIAHYNMLAEKNPNFKKFLKGWHNRAVAV